MPRSFGRTITFALGLATVAVLGACGDHGADDHAVDPPRPTQSSPAPAASVLSACGSVDVVLTDNVDHGEPRRIRG